MPLWKRLPGLLQPETADREGSLAARRISELRARLPATHRSSLHESDAGTPVLAAIENAAACVKRKKRRNLIPVVFVNHYHLGSMSKRILYIKTQETVTILFQLITRLLSATSTLQLQAIPQRTQVGI